MNPEEVLSKIAALQADLSALTAAVAEYVSVSLSRAADARPAKKQRWRYVPGSWYRITGENPFRNGNNYNLFEFLRRRYGTHPFSREDLSTAISYLREHNRIDSRQDEEQIVLVFLRTGGAEKGRLAMSSSPSADEQGPIADVADALPPEAGEARYRLLGDMPFRSGVNVLIWQRMGNKPFGRDEITAVVKELVSAQAFDSIRPPETIVRDFLGRVQEKGRLERVY